MLVPKQKEEKMSNKFCIERDTISLNVRIPEVRKNEFAKTVSLVLKKNNKYDFAEPPKLVSLSGSKDLFGDCVTQITIKCSDEDKFLLFLQEFFQEKQETYIPPHLFL